MLCIFWKNSLITFRMHHVRYFPYLIRVKTCYGSRPLAENNRALSSVFSSRKLDSINDWHIPTMIFTGSGNIFASCSSPAHSSRTILRVGNNRSKHEVNSVHMTSFDERRHYEGSILVYRVTRGNKNKNRTL